MIHWLPTIVILEPLEISLLNFGVFAKELLLLQQGVIITNYFVNWAYVLKLDSFHRLVVIVCSII